MNWHIFWCAMIGGGMATITSGVNDSLRGALISFGITVFIASAMGLFFKVSEDTRPDEFE